MKIFSSHSLNHISLLSQLIKRDIDLRFKGSMLGIFWPLLTPLLTLAMYAFVFGSFMRAKWPGAEGIADFALILFPGLILFNFFAECVNRAPSLIIINPNFVKKVVFPLDLLVWIPIGSALFHLALSIFGWIVITLVVKNTIPWTVLFLPIIICPLILVILGLSWLLAGFGVYLRDTAQITPVITQALMFLSPVLYPLDNVPKDFAWLIMLNPLTIIVEEVRKVMIYDTLPDFMRLSLYTAVGITVYSLGIRFFRAVRPGFADVV